MKREPVWIVRVFHGSVERMEPRNEIETGKVLYGQRIFMGELLKSRGQTIEKDYLIPESEIALHGYGLGITGTRRP
jgi:hypothetical protein